MRNPPHTIPVSLPSGDTVHIRALTPRECKLIQSVEPHQQAGVMIGFILVGSDGKQAFTRRDGESLRNFSWRVAGDLDVDVVTTLIKASTNQAKKLRAESAARMAAKPKRRWRFW